MMSNAASSNADRALITRIHAGDAQAFEELYMTYAGALWQFAYRYVRERAVAEDVVQDVFRKLWERREGLDVDTSLDAYLYGAVRNRALRLMQDDARSQQLTDEHPVPVPSDQGAVDDNLSLAVQTFLQGLPDPVGQILLLRWQHGMQYDDIAEVLGISSAYARQQVHRVLRRVGTRLRRLIQE